MRRRGMGGYGSGRWAWARTRATTDGLLRLDVRRLARDGCLRPGRWDVAWRRGEEVLGRIAVIGRRDDPPEVTLEYRVRAGDGPWEPMRERIGLERTPCRYGGERPWFRCPGCGRRRAVLYSVGGRFRCRGCHDLAYGSTREGAGERDHRRADGLRSRLGAPAGTRVAMPEKPKHMRWR